jgi:hypothetical protein
MSSRTSPRCTVTRAIEIGGHGICDLQSEVVLVVVDDETDAPPLGRRVAGEGSTADTPCRHLLQQ